MEIWTKGLKQFAVRIETACIETVLAEMSNMTVKRTKRAIVRSTYFAHQW